MTPPAVRVTNLSKCYRIGVRQNGQKTFREALVDGIKAPFRNLTHLRSLTRFTDGGSEENIIWALKDINFEVQQGEVLGIIGANGAGKSTLLKILSRITEPTTGQVEIRGRVSSLLEVGTGFHPELTGRENVYLNAAILGMRKAEIDRKFDEIVEFSGVEKFIDTPVKRYSSGMQVRLAFAVAAHIDPEILIVDEVLAVGDAAFQKKCLGKMGEVASEGRTVLFVSHNMGAVTRLCSAVALLAGGGLQAIGDPNKIVDRYLSYGEKGAAIRTFSLESHLSGQIVSVRLLDEQGKPSTCFRVGSEPVIEIDFVLNHRAVGCHVACILKTLDGYHLLSSADSDSCPELLTTERPPGSYSTKVKLPISMLNSGTYALSVGIGVPGIEVFDRRDVAAITMVDTQGRGAFKGEVARAGLLLVNAPWHYTQTPNNDA